MFTKTFSWINNKYQKIKSFLNFEKEFDVVFEVFWGIFDRFILDPDGNDYPDYSSIIMNDDEEREKYLKAVKDSYNSKEDIRVITKYGTIIVKGKKS